MGARGGGAVAAGRAITVPGGVAGSNSRAGVYAMRDFEIGDAIIQYDGKDLGGEHDEDIEGKKRGKRHLLAVNGRVLDGKWHVAGAINSAIAMHGNNVIIAGSTGMFRAAKRILAGEELLVDYGPRYRNALAAENRGRLRGEIYDEDDGDEGEGEDSMDRWW